MSADLDDLLEHDMSDECPICRTQQIVDLVVIPALTAWEATNQLPRHAMALHGAAGLLATMLEDGIGREAVERALSGLLDEMEQHIAENAVFGGPPQGTA